jgi:hypothetical protein
MARAVESIQESRWIPPKGQGRPGIPDEPAPD